MTARALPAEIVEALKVAQRSPGWNNRTASIRRFDVGGCRLYVVPARVWTRPPGALPLMAGRINAG